MSNHMKHVFSMHIYKVLINTNQIDTLTIDKNKALKHNKTPGKYVSVWSSICKGDIHECCKFNLIFNNLHDNHLTDKHLFYWLYLLWPWRKMTSTSKKLALTKSTPLSTMYSMLCRARFTQAVIKEALGAHLRVHFRRPHSDIIRTKQTTPPPHYCSEHCFHNRSTVTEHC